MFSNAKNYIAYLTAGDGTLDYIVDVAAAIKNAGVDILELGFPYSDPIADGPVIQGAMRRALQCGMNSALYLTWLEKIATHIQIPIIVFTYYNPLLQLGEYFYAALKQAGAAGILVVDLPFELAEEHHDYCDKYQLDPIYLCTLATPMDRFERIAAHGRGFIYYVAQLGTTGMKSDFPEALLSHLVDIKKHSPLPIAAGFGVQSQAQAQQLLSIADAFVVGSFLVNKIAQQLPSREIFETMRALDPR